MMFIQFIGALIMLIITMVVGLVVLVLGRKSRRRQLIGIGIIAFPWVILGAMAFLRPGIDEWNPSIERDSETWGNWEGDGYRIELHPDATFSARLNGLKGPAMKGKWKRDDWNLYLTAEDQQKLTMRFVRDGGKLVLLPQPPDDPDEGPGPIVMKK
jgi:hypothetical protein